MLKINRLAGLAGSRNAGLYLYAPSVSRDLSVIGGARLLGVLSRLTTGFKTDSRTYDNRLADSRTCDNRLADSRTCDNRLTELATLLTHG